MSYQPLPDASGGRSSDASGGRSSAEDPPDYDGRAQYMDHGRSAATTFAEPSSSSSGQHASNYIHISDVGDILGAIYDINTDAEPIYGRFDSQEEQDNAPNVLLSAINIDAEIRLSGSKKAKIEVKGSTDSTYGRTMIRIIYPSSVNPTPFSLTLSATDAPTCLIALPEEFKGSITGACTLSGHLADTAMCLVADALRSRWIVGIRQGQGQGSSTSHLGGTQTTAYPPSSGSEVTKTFLETADGADEANRSSVNLVVVPKKGSANETKGSTLRKFRHIISTSDYMSGLSTLKQAEENERAEAKKAFLICGSVLSTILTVIQMIAALAKADKSTHIILFVVPAGMSLMVPAIILGEFWSVLTYKIPNSVPDV